MALSRERYSAIGHTGMAFWNPVGEAVLDEWIAALPLGPHSRVLDVGCGRAELLLRMIECHGCAAVGVDSSALVIDLAQGERARRLPEADCELRCEPFTAASFAPHDLDLACCVGSTHAIADYPATLQVLAGLVRRGGLILVGEGYWRREPDAAYLAALQATREDFRFHAGNIELAGELGLQLVRASEASDADWRCYEDGYAANIYAHLAAHPDDPDAEAIRQRIDPWREAYLRWGRNTLGFGLYLFCTPA